MDLNIVVVAGQLATEPEHRTFTTGTTQLRLLITTRTTGPNRRVDVIPVTFWNPPEDLLTEPLERGTRLWVCGTVQRRFWPIESGERSRIEIVALDVQRHPAPDAESRAQR